MSRNPLNLALRFLLELAAIVIFGAWGYSLTEDGTRYLLAFLFPVFFATLWGVFAVREDPSRSGKTVVSTPGAARLVLELALFTASAWMLYGLGQSTLGIIFGGAVLLHYLLSWDRITWLLKQKRS
jgi:hypothetical protein